MASERLYDLAFRYKKVRLWKQLDDSEIFAVRFSDGELGYCCVLGMAGETFALVVYPGAKGFQSYRALAECEEEVDFFPLEQMLTQDCVQCTFENADELSEEEAEEVREYAAALGLKLRGKNAFPQFLRLRPRHVPWPCDSDLEEQYLSDALEAALFLSDSLKSSTKEELRISSFRDGPEEFPLCVRENGGWALQYTPVPEPPATDFPAPALENDVTVARLKRLTAAGTLECRLITLPAPVQEDRAKAPYFPIMLLGVYSDREVPPIAPEPSNPDEDAGALLEAFSAAVLASESRPRAIHVADAQAEALLRDFCARTGTVLQLVAELPELEDALEDLYDTFDEYGDEDWDEDWDDDEAEDALPENLLIEMADALERLLRSTDDGETPQRPRPLPKASRSRGNCYLCGGEYSAGGYGKHFSAKHAYTGADAQDCALLRVADADTGNYWLFLDIPLTSTLQTLDTFLRKIWLECCGHMSAFYDGDCELGMSRKLSSFPVGTVLHYEYDFGDTTELSISVAGRSSRPKQREAVRLLARNAPEQYVCAECGAPAAWICVECQWEEENPFFCEKCADKHRHSESLLPVTNSPRMGVCAYDGAQDYYEFTPPEK